MEELKRSTGLPNQLPGSRILDNGDLIDDSGKILGNVIDYFPMSNAGNRITRLTPYDASYGACERTYAELRIYAGAMEPELVTKRLQVSPTSIQKKGEKKVNSLGRVREVPLNGWFFSSEGKVSSLDVRHHLDWLLDRIEPARNELRYLQSMAGLTMQIDCVWWSSTGHGGPTLWPEQMRRIAALDLECSFDIYFFGDDEENHQ